MKRCKTCKFWNSYERFNNPKWGDCLKAGSTNGSAEYPSTLAMAMDFEGYMASLQTFNRFGCVQWEKKDA